MLPFFRKIRWRLAANSQFFKYSRYAIGEIVLVVIGILIALQINNWNEDRKSNNELNRYLKLMTKDIQLDSIFFNRILETNLFHTNYLTALSIGNYDSINLENAQNIICLNYIDREISSYYKAIKDNGTFEKIKDEKLKDALNYYYESAFREFNDFSLWHRDFVISHIEGYMMVHLPLDINGFNEPLQVINEMKNKETVDVVNYQLENHKQFHPYIDWNIQAAETLTKAINEYIEN